MISIVPRGTGVQVLLRIVILSEAKNPLLFLNERLRLSDLIEMPYAGSTGEGDYHPLPFLMETKAAPL